MLDPTHSLCRATWPDVVGSKSGHKLTVEEPPPNQDLQKFQELQQRKAGSRRAAQADAYHWTEGHEYEPNVVSGDGRYRKGGKGGGYQH